MKVRGITTTGDWMFGKGRNDYKINKDAVAQNIKTRLQSFLGDCFFALNEGIDWFNLLGNKNLPALTIAIRSTILNTDGVSKLIQVSLSLDEDRNLSISYEVETVYGVVEDEIEPLSQPPDENSYLLLETGGFLLLETGGDIIL